MPYLIDGHNVIAALPDIDLEDQHDEAKLVLKLRAWTGRRRRKAIVIFDGGIPGGYSRNLSSSAVRVVFAARRHSTADDIIRERLSRLPDTPNWTVVSSDHEVLDNARQVGAKTIMAQDFADVLNREPDAQKIKPDAISAAEVEAWLAEFPEPPPSPETQSATATSASPPSEKPKAPRSRANRRSRRATPGGKPVRTTRTIGEQVGVESQHPVQQRELKRRTEKPDEISAAEVDAWLEVFHDPPDSTVPPPKRRAKPIRRKPRQLVVNKDAGLSAEEVDGWLEVFGDLEEAPPAPVEKKDSPKAKPKSGTPSARLVKRKRNLVPVEEKKSGELSPEDEALWRRMFGEGDA